MADETLENGKHPLSGTRAGVIETVSLSAQGSVIPHPAIKPSRTVGLPELGFGKYFCHFCGECSVIQCDGVLENGSVCGKWVCRRCTYAIAMIEAVTKTGQRGHGRPAGVRDLCPDCVQAGRRILF